MFLESEMEIMKKAYVGSLNKIKVGATTEVLSQYGYEVIGIDAPSQVSAQPMTDDETIEGATNRALGLPTDGLRIGLEAGVMLHKDTLFLTNWGVLIDEDGNRIVAGGTRIALPDEVKKTLFEDGLELSDAMAKHYNTKDIKFKEGAIGYFSNSLVTRNDNFVHIIKLLYGRYLYMKGLK